MKEFICKGEKIFRKEWNSKKKQWELQESCLQEILASQGDIDVYGGREIRQQLKEAGFKWNPFEKKWFRRDEIGEEVERLEKAVEMRKQMGMIVSEQWVRNALKKTTTFEQEQIEEIIRRAKEKSIIF
jgi:hypothetical protein